MNELIVPASITAGSVCFLILHALFAAAKNLRRHRENETFTLSADTAGTGAESTSRMTFSGLAKRHIVRLGGPVIFSFKLLRLSGCITLALLSIATALKNSRGEVFRESLVHSSISGAASAAIKCTDGSAESCWLYLSLSLTYVNPSASDTTLS